jgi:hypothetical protein
MVLDGYLVLVEILMLEISPSPLAVVAVAHGACAHGAVANEEEHRIIPLAGRTGHRASLIGKGYGVGSKVADAVDVNPDVIVLLTVGRQKG